MTLTQDDIDEKIINAKPKLLATLGRPTFLNVRLKARLQQMGVITEDLNDEMERAMLTPKERVGLLLDDFRFGPEWRFLHFCKVMHEEGKADVLKALDVDIVYIEDQLEMLAAEGDLPPEYTWGDDTFPTESPAELSLTQTVLSYFSSFLVWVVHLLRQGWIRQTRRVPQKRHFYQQEEGDEKREIPAQMLPALLQHCEALERTLMQTRLFDFSEDVLLDLTDLYVSTEVSVKLNEREQRRIGVREFFMRLFQSHAPNSLLLEGEAGSGKSSLLRQYAHSFCKQFLECHNKGPDVPCEGHVWKMVVYTAAGSINTSAEHAIKNSLMCKTQLKKQLMNAISQDGAGVLVLKDGMDELRKKESIQSIRKYTKDCQEMVGKPKILLSSRNGLSQIERVLFDRILMIEGFTLDQGLQYVEKYFKLRQNLTDHPVLTYIKAHKEEVEWVLRNPLQALIFSELTARGELTLRDIGTLSRVKLLKVFEMHIIRRDEERRQADKTQGGCFRFYKSCLKCLLKDKRRMTENDVESNSPHLAFLNKYKHTDLYANTQNYFMFGHEMFLEFFSIQGLIQCLKSNSPSKQAMLLYLCANSTMRNALLLTCGFISEYEPGLFPDLVFIIQACLVLQVEKQRFVKNALTEALLQLPAIIQETFPPDIFTQGLMTEQARTMEDVSQTIQRAFNQDAESLRASGWFLNGYLFAGEDRFYYEHYKFIMACVRQCTPEKQEEICSQTTHQLLPCVRLSAMSQGSTLQEAVFPVSSDRWGTLRQVTMDGRTVTKISVWCPSDLTSTLTQYDTHRHQIPPSSAHSVTVYLHDHGSLWGAQPADVLTHGDWVPGLCQVFKHRVTDMTVYTDHVSCTSPLDGLLTALQHAVPDAHSLTGGVEVWHGRVGAEVLQEFCEWTRRVKLQVALWNTTIVLRTERDEDDVTRLHQCVQDVARGLTYVTPEGQRVKHPDDRDDNSSDRDEIDDLDNFLRSLESRTDVSEMFVV